MQLEKLGRYRIVRELGRGAMGMVFLAHDPEIDRLVAIKAIQVFASLPDAERQTARERFLREARSAGKLLHPGIVTLFDVGEADGIPYLAMEYIEGETLDAFCASDRLLPASVAVEMVSRAAQALAFAHRAGIVHRDIKPANLMRVEGNAVKIMDFGLAKSPQAQLTQDGALLGTPSYMSPEQVRGDTLDGRSDLFSLGVVLYELLSGEKPFGGESISSVLFRIVHEEAREAASISPAVSPALSAFLRRALAKNPEERFPDGDAFASSLREAALGSVPAAAAPARPAEAPPAPRKTVARESPRGAPSSSAPRPGRSRVPLLAGAVVVVAAIATALFLVFHAGAPDAGKPAGPWVEARVRTEPPGLPVTLDGKPLVGDRVRFSAAGPFGLLETSQDCRRVGRRLEAADAGGEVVLVADPVRVEVLADPGVEGARVRLNGADAGRAPVKLLLSLCRENAIDVRAPGYRDVSITVPAGATPVEARTAVARLRLDAVPNGRLRFPEIPMPVTLFVDGRRVGNPREGIELAEGRHEVRALSEEYWVDVRAEVEIRGGESVTARLPVPGLASVRVTANPSNCRVYLARDGGKERYLDDTPVMDRKVAAGRYRVRVEFVPTGASKEEVVDVVAGRTTELSFSFPRAGRP